MDITLADWSYIGAIISGAATLGIFLVTVSANKSIKNISEYTNRQVDRKVVEDIFTCQRESEIEFSRTASFDDIHPMINLTKAREMARLYKLDHIRLHLQKIIDAYGEGHELHFRIWDQNGQYASTFKSQDMDRYHKIVKDVLGFFDDIACYQSYLRISPP